MTASIERQLVVGDQRYTLKYSARAWAALQDHYALPSLNAVQARLADPDRFGIPDMVAVIWAGMRTHHRDVSPDDVLGMIDEIGLEETGRAIADAFAGAAPAVEEGAAGAGALDPRPDPRPSGPSTTS